jgi:rhamnogalacturonyl hydrolase YesR
MLSQLLDFPGSYLELTATCMTGYAVARGLRMGWLDESYREFVDSLWRAASERIGADGAVVDGCTGTGAVNDRRFYLDRAAEYDQDDRTGNLALWFAVEMERLVRSDD